MKKKSVMMFGVAAILSSAFFTGSAFAREDRGPDDYNTIYNPFSVPAHPAQLDTAVKNVHVPFELQVNLVQQQADRFVDNLDN